MNEEINTEGYLLLREAIIKQAYSDYWLADSPISGLSKEEVISFFKSDWYKSLLTIDADYILRKGEELMKYKKISLLHGYVVVPDDYVVAMNTKTPLSDYCGGVVEKHGLTPHYLVFSEKPIQSLSEDEKYEIFEKVGDIDSGFMELLLHEVDPIYKDDIMVNYQEWMHSPHMMLFQIKERSGDLEYGMRIVREKKL